MLQIIFSVFLFLAAISLLIVVHELGHFSVARLLKVKVLRFAVGFGKPLIKWRSKKGTEYTINRLPIGGYVKMLDERESRVPANALPYAFNRKPLWARFLIVLAGPLANFLFAIAAYWLVFVVGIASVAPVIGKVTPHSIADVGGLRANQEIVAINEQPTPNWSAVELALLSHLHSDQITVKTRTLGSAATQHATLSLTDWQLEEGEGLSSLGLAPYFPPIPPIVAEVVEGQAAAQAGLRVGDKIVAVNGKPINDWRKLVGLVQKQIGKPLSLTVERSGKSQIITVTPRSKIVDGKAIGFMGVIAQSVPYPKDLIRKQQFGVLDAIAPAVQKTGAMFVTSLRLLGHILTGYLPLQSISGPVGIAVGSYYYASLGFAYYLTFLALISISIGMINLLPIPMLDGGHLLFYAIEFIRGRPLSDMTQDLCARAGMMALVVLMAFTLFNDIARIIG